MIRYPTSEADLRKQIEATAPGWLVRTQALTETFRTAGRYLKGNDLWGEVKPVYREIQKNKCAYCERRLAGARHGSGEQHVDHFRPKHPVKAWPSPKIAKKRELSYTFSTGSSLAEGYYLLTYHPFNYALACRTCNSPLKWSYFPVAGPRNGLGEDPRTLASELPLLLYPLGDLDEDPEDLLTFVGVTCVARASATLPLRRAQVTIDFFALNDREELWRGRAETLRNVYLALEVLNDPGFGRQAKRLADQRLREMLAPQSEYTNCARSFRRLYQGDAQLAGELAGKAQAYLDSES